MSKMKVLVRQLNGCNRCAWHLLALESFDSISLIGHSLLGNNDNNERVDAVILTGFATRKDREMLEGFRDRADLIALFGTCPYTGGIFGLANQRGASVLPVEDLIKVDMNIAGCPPGVGTLIETLTKGTSTLMSPLCSTCNREFQKQYLKEIIHTPSWDDSTTCFNNQGLPCSGVVSAECAQRCIDFNTPCRGCVPNVNDSGPGALGYFTSLAGQMDVDTKATEWTTDMLGDKPDEITKGIPDVVGTFFRYTLAHDFKRAGRLPTTGGLCSDIMTGRLIQEAPQIAATIYGSRGISVALTLIEAYENAIGVEPSEKTREIRSELRKIQATWTKLERKPDSKRFAEIVKALKTFAGNEVLSNVYFSGFKVPLKDVEYTFDAYSIREIDWKAASGYAEDENCKVSITVDDRGIIREWSCELR